MVGQKHDGYVSHDWHCRIFPVRYNAERPPSLGKQYDKACTGLRRDVFEDAKYPELSKAMKYFKQTEGGRSEVCKTVEDYAKSYAREERLDAIRRMIRKKYDKAAILDLGYSEEEFDEAEKGLLVNA